MNWKNEPITCHKQYKIIPNTNGAYDLFEIDEMNGRSYITTCSGTAEAEEIIEHLNKDSFTTEI